MYTRLVCYNCILLLGVIFRYGADADVTCEAFVFKGQEFEVFHVCFLDCKFFCQTLNGTWLNKQNPVSLNLFTINFLILTQVHINVGSTTHTEYTKNLHTHTTFPHIHTQTETHIHSQKIHTHLQAQGSTPHRVRA